MPSWSLHLPTNCILDNVLRNQDDLEQGPSMPLLSLQELINGEQDVCLSLEFLMSPSACELTGT